MNSKKSSQVVFAFRPARIRTRTGDRKSHSPENLSSASQRKRSLCLRSDWLGRLLTRLQKEPSPSPAPLLANREARPRQTTSKYRPLRELDANSILGADNGGFSNCSASGVQFLMEGRGQSEKVLLSAEFPNLRDPLLITGAPAHLPVVGLVRMAIDA